MPSRPVTFGPWNPGIVSPVPDQLMGLCTVFRPENVFTSLAQARELHALTGLARVELVAFRPQRLALHELLVRITANVSVPDGVRIEDLGINFRRITGTLLANYLEPRRDRIESTYAAVRRSLAEYVGAQAAALDPDGATLRDWESKAQSGANAVERAGCRALARVLSAILVRHGRLWGSREMIAAVATDLACNQLASEEIGRLIEPWIGEAAAAEGWPMLPPQAAPVVFNTKGASASGKSTLRPLQRELAGAIGVSWSEFALISPDIWRKQLLDYATLGAEYKYGGSFTGDEIHIIDRKLDRYMAGKAELGEMSHLLIDRFRFDSFAPDSDEAGSNLLTRFGQIVYLFFMITPPGSLVERAWKRGLDVGRYKAVDDTLAHAIEAYSGMPQLFFTWVKRADKRVHFEFLDNSVGLGERPRTVAFGWNDRLTVLDVKCMLDVERYRRVNVGAVGPESLYDDPKVLDAANNTAFLRQAVRQFREVEFAEQGSGRVYLHVVAGNPVWADRVALERAAADPDTRAGIMASLPEAFDAASSPIAGERFLEEAERLHTLGAWGPR
ncbi:MAG: hypothetical protein ACXWF6_14100 [Usitatibacter sp.]